jgi:RNA polymerase sigma-70 factor, ECF subfamily
VQTGLYKSDVSWVLGAFVVYQQHLEKKFWNLILGRGVQVDDNAGTVKVGELTDEELVAQSKDGSREAFSQLVTRYQDRVINLVAQRISDRESAYDIAQEVFIKAFRGLAGFKSEAGFYTWLYRIAINTTLSYRRKVKRHGPMLSLDRSLGRNDEGRSKIEVADTQDGPGDVAVRREQVDAVRAAIALLDDDFNEVIVLRDLQGMSYEEISVVLNCPVGSIKSRLHRARKKLLEVLQKNSI